ncbi:hypothetical protein [Streptomyces roseoverticillatus]|uniref:hypothetical protein n=1 Tax=Streptomyces roseoverticillatus TaxID=66429 RepID=UPI0004BED007|nr:hypothetical protein [Streptomyces roseoverticillatus]
MTATAFSDVAEPTACLVPPGEPGELDPLKPFNDAAEVLTPSGWLFKLAELYTGQDPLKWAEKFLTGDWDAFAKCASAWRETGHACEGVARNLRSGSTRIDATWDGNAAETAARYFSALAGNLEEFHASFGAMGTEYLVVAQSVMYAGAAIGDCLGAILDALITGTLIAVAEAATGGAAAAAAAALGTQELLTILREWEHMTLLATEAQMCLHAGYGVLGRIGAEALASLNSFPVPRAGYDHPAV